MIIALSKIRFYVELFFYVSSPHKIIQPGQRTEKVSLPRRSFLSIFPHLEPCFWGNRINFIHLPADHAEKPLISVDFYRPKCVDRRYLFRWRSASFFRRTCTAQSGQYLARLELGVNAAPQTAQRLISSRPLVISAHRAASNGRTATLNHRHSSE